MKKEILEALTIVEEEENRTEKDIEIIRKAKQEIERLQKILRTKTRLHRKRKAKLIKLRKEITNKQKRLELLNSIIKEVREYIQESDIYKEDILQILDKVEEK